MKTTSISILIIISSVVACAQDQRLIDSLQSELKNHNEQKLELGKISPAMFDTTAANILYELSKAYWYGQPDKALALANQSKAISETIGYKKGVGFALYSIGVSYTWKIELPQALEFTIKALKFGEAIGNKKLIASAYTNLGVVNNFKSNYPEALKNNFVAIKIAEEIADKQIMSWNFGNIAFLYLKQANYEYALKYSFDGLTLAKEARDKIGMAGFYTLIGDVYTEMGKYSEAITNNFMALEIQMNLGDDYATAITYNSLGFAYQRQGNYNEALKYYFKFLKKSEDINNEESKGFAYGVIGEVYSEKKEFLKAIEFLNKGLKAAKEFGNIVAMKCNYQYLSSSYQALAVSPFASSQQKADFAIKALENYKLFIIYRDSIVNIESTKKITQQQMLYDFDKKEAATKSAQEKKQALAAAEIQKHKLIRNFSYAGISVVLLIIGYAFYRFRENKNIESKQSLLNERLRISRELHDDMGSTLSSISVYSEVAKNRAVKNENETEVLQKIGTASRELIEKMSDIVWSLNPNNENFEQLKNRMMAFAAMMLTPKGILFEFEIDEEVKSTAITPEQRKNIFLIYKEAINNIVKYSEATSVKVKMNVRDNKLSLSIFDNGVGFDSLSFGEGRGEVYNGNGLKNMKARADEIKAWFNVTSRINEGTGIELSFNI